MVDFAGGLAQGLQGLPNEIGKLQEMARARKMAAALLNTYTGNQPPQGGGAPAPQGGAPMPPTAALAALAPKPVPAPPAAPNPRSRFPVVPGQPDPLAPRPAPAPPPGAPTGQPGAEAPTGMSVAPGLADPVKEGQSLLKNLWMTTKQANPKADPLTIMQAVNAQIDDIKGIAPVTKATMQGQLQLMGFTLKATQFQQKESDENARYAMKMQDLVTHHANQDAIAAENERHRAAMVSIAQERADAYGEGIEYSHEDRQAATGERATASAESNTTRRDIATGHDETQKDIAGQRSKDSKYRSDQSVRGAQVRSGAPPGNAPSAAGLGMPPDARKAPDGHWYAKRQGQWVRYD